MTMTIGLCSFGQLFEQVRRVVVYNGLLGLSDLRARLVAGQVFVTSEQQAVSISTTA
jgi:hypothetical protein